MKKYLPYIVGLMVLTALGIVGYIIYLKVKKPSLPGAGTKPSSSQAPTAPAGTPASSIYNIGQYF